MVNRETYSEVLPLCFDAYINSYIIFFIKTISKLLCQVNDFIGL